MNPRWVVALVSMALSLGVACSDSSQQPATMQSESTAVATSGSGEAGAPSAGMSAGSAGDRARSEPRATAGARAPTRGVSAGAGAGGVQSTPATTSDAGRGGMVAATASAAGSTAGSAGTVAANGCSRELLRSQVAAYFTALAAHDPSSLPLADNVRFTENGAQTELGKSGLWSTAGALEHVHSALDTETCSAVAQAVVPDGSAAIPVALRLKLVSQQITEIETIAVREGDYMLRSDTDALIASDQTVHWQEPVPPDQRNTREELSAWMDKYFRLFPRGVCDTTSACKRIENGGGSFNCNAGASCASSAPGPSDRALDPRLILVDVDTGVGVGFTMFQSNTDMHIFKMFGGEIHGVSAILAKADSSGWE